MLGCKHAINKSLVGPRATICEEPFDFYKVHYKRLSIHSTEPRRDIDMRRFFQEGVQLVLDGLVNTSEIVTHEVLLSDIDRALALRHHQSNDAIHVLVDCESSDR